MQIGSTLQGLRKRQGRTLRDLAGITRIPHASLEQLEADAFSALPPPLYVEGFIRAYCEALGEDPSGPLLAYQRHVIAEERTKAPVSAPPTLFDKAHEWTADRLSLAHGVLLAVASLAFIVALIGALGTEPAEEMAATEEAPLNSGDVISSASPGE
jgi:cytoskeletal protein RodZ